MKKIKKHDIIMGVMYKSVKGEIKMKKYIGGFLLMLTTVFINAGTASAFMIGNEDMPESIKKIR